MQAVGNNKRCSSCKIWQATSCFHKNKKTPDGYHDQCKLCRKEYEQRPEVRKAISITHRRNAIERRERERLDRKRCTGCKQWKLRSEFSKRSKSVDGLCYRCKQCQSEYRTIPEVKARRSEVKRLLRHDVSIEPRFEQGEVHVHEDDYVSPIQEAAFRRNVRIRWMQEMFAKFGMKI